MQSIPSKPTSMRAGPWLRTAYLLHDLIDVCRLWSHPICHRDASILDVPAVLPQRFVHFSRCLHGASCAHPLPGVNKLSSPTATDGRFPSHQKAAPIALCGSTGNRKDAAVGNYHALEHTLLG